MHRALGQGRMLQLSVASLDRRGERPLGHPAGFSSMLVADGYAGFNGFYEKARLGGARTDAVCWAHTR